MNLVRIRMPEEFTVDEVAKFRELTYEQISKGALTFELDFVQCRFIDSTGLGAIVSVYKKIAEHGGNVVLFGMKENVLRIVKMTRLDQVFTIR